jgi:predicted enzyme related to lactoylglutathione lyase
LPRPIHFQITADDPARASAFGRGVFGWKFQKWEGDMPGWTVA